MRMIYFVTDQWAGEPDILAPVRHEILYIKDLSGDLIVEICPADKVWTHKALLDIAKALSDGEMCEDGANAYLGHEWVGSTEC